MKLLAFFLLAFLSGVLAYTEYENAVECGRKSPLTNQAIDAFCNRRGPKGKLLNNIVVPSPYSRNGKAASANGVTIVVSIMGTCAPAQWVPITYCLSQFHSICGDSGVAYGQGIRTYGRNKCQSWVIRKL